MVLIDILKSVEKVSQEDDVADYESERFYGMRFIMSYYSDIKRLAVYIIIGEKKQFHCTTIWNISSSDLDSIKNYLINNVKKINRGVIEGTFFLH